MAIGNGFKGKGGTAMVYRSKQLTEGAPACCSMRSVWLAHCTMWGRRHAGCARVETSRRCCSGGSCLLMKDLSAAQGTAQPPTPSKSSHKGSEASLGG